MSERPSFGWVKDKVDEVVAKVVEYKRLIHAGGKVVNPIEGYERK